MLRSSQRVLGHEMIQNVVYTLLLFHHLKCTCTCTQKPWFWCYWVDVFFISYDWNAFRLRKVLYSLLLTKIKHLWIKISGFLNWMNIFCTHWITLHGAHTFHNHIHISLKVLDIANMFKFHENPLKSSLEYFWVFSHCRRYVIFIYEMRKNASFCTQPNTHTHACRMNVM